MSVGRSGLIAVFFALAGLCASAATAQAQTFHFRVCNNTNIQASVATVSYVSTTNSRFVIQGWWNVKPGSCRWLGYFPNGWFYYYAEQTDTQEYVWDGHETTVCVRHPGPFERLDTPNYTCRSDEELRGFNGKFIPGNIGTFTWHLD